MDASSVRIRPGAGLKTEDVAGGAERPAVRLHGQFTVTSQKEESGLEPKRVRTVCGDLTPEALGWCQIHEHIFVHDTPAAQGNPALRIDDFVRSLAELKAYRACGGTSLCDAQPVAAGRDCEMLARLSGESGVVIVASTGYHLPVFYAPDCWVDRLEEEALYDLYCEELTLGMLLHTEDPTARPRQRSDIRAGMVKAAIGKDGPAGRLGTLLRAAARAAADTGSVLMLHTERGMHMGEAVELARECGLPARRMIVCHVDRQAEDFGPHEAAAKTGVWLDYDTIGRFRYHSDEAEVKLIRHMADCGYGGQLLFALDTTAARLGAYGGEISLRYLHDTFLPRLREAGLEQVGLAATGEHCRQVFETL